MSDFSPRQILGRVFRPLINRLAVEALVIAPVPLPTGASTEAKQDTQIDLLQDILDKDTEIHLEAEQINLNTDDFERGQILQAIAASKWMELAAYDRIETDLSGNVWTLNYYEKNNSLGKAVVTFTDSDFWTFLLTRYITEDDGNPLLDDDSTELNLD